MNNAGYAGSDSEQDNLDSKEDTIIPSNQKIANTKEFQKAQVRKSCSSSSQVESSQQSIQEFVSFIQINEIELIANDHQSHQDYAAIHGDETTNQTLGSSISHDQFDVDRYRKLTLKQKFNYINNTANSINNQADFSLNLYKSISIPQREYMDLRRMLKKQYELSQAQRGVKVNELLLFERKLKELDQLWEEIKGQLQIALKRQKQEEERFQKVVNNKRDELGKKGEEQEDKEQEEDNCYWDNQAIVEEETQQIELNQGCKENKSNQNIQAGRIYNMMSKDNQNRILLNKRDDKFSNNRQLIRLQQDQYQQRDNSNGNTVHVKDQYPPLNNRLNINIININNSKTTIRSPSPQQSAARISTENTMNNLPINRSTKPTGTVAVSGSLERKQFIVRNANERIHKLIQGSPLRVYSPISRDASLSPQRIPFDNSNNDNNKKSTKESGQNSQTNPLFQKNRPSNNSKDNSNTLKINPNTNGLADQLPPKNQTNSQNRNNFIDKSTSQQQLSTKALSAQSQQQQFHEDEPISRQQHFTSSANSVRQLPRNNTNNKTTGSAVSQNQRSSSPISKEQRVNKVFTVTKQYQESQ